MLTPQFPRLFLWHVARHARRHPLLAGLNILSVALGVSVYLAIQIANHSANQSFAASIDLVAGKANLEVRSPSGSFDETLLPKLMAADGVKAATPLVEGYATLPDSPGEYLQILGVDPFTNLPFATFSVGDQSAAADWDHLNLESWLGDPQAIALTDEFAQLHHLKIGDPLHLQINGQDQTLTVRFLIRLGQTVAGRGNSRVAAMDIGWAQRLFGRNGRLSSVQILLDQPREATAAAARLSKIVPADVTVSAPGQRSGQVDRMLASFELNLSALSLISLLVGMFLIYNTIAASVVRRRQETGILRAVGASRLEVQLLFLSEALSFGVIGVLLGIAGGICLARFLLGREIARVISTLYSLVSVERYSLSPWLVGSAFFFGLGSVLAAAYLPAREGAQADPVAALSFGLGTARQKSWTDARHWLIAGLASLAIAWLCSWLALTTGPAFLGFGSAFFVLLGFAFTAPTVTSLAAGLITRVTQPKELLARPDHSPQSGHLPMDKPPSLLNAGCMLVRLAAQNLRRSLHRNAIIVAALMAAIAMTVGISVMIHAFRGTVETWINRAIVADIFMTPAANETLGGGAFFPPEALAALAREPMVSSVDTVREIGVNIRGDRISMAVVEGQDRDRLAFVGGNASQKQLAFHQPDHVLVSEPFAHRYHVREGDRLSVPTPDGVLPFTVAGVYYDYTRDSGVIAVTRENFIRHWHDDRVMSAAIYLKDPAKVDAAVNDIRTHLNTHGEFLIYSNRAIRTRVFEIFEQTFRITGVLRLIAVAVAVIGIFLTLTTLVTERAREIGTMRAVGASPGQIQGMILVESGLIGGIAGMLGMVAGLALSLVLTFVINKAFFGWTIQLSFPWGNVLATPVWIILAAIAAGWGPAVRAGKIPIASAVREE